MKNIFSMMIGIILLAVVIQRQDHSKYELRLTIPVIPSGKYYFSSVRS